MPLEWPSVVPNRLEYRAVSELTCRGSDHGRHCSEASILVAQSPSRVRARIAPEMSQRRCCRQDAQKRSGIHRLGECHRELFGEIWATRPVINDRHPNLPAERSPGRVATLCYFCKTRFFLRRFVLERSSRVSEFPRILTRGAFALGR